MVAQTAYVRQDYHGPLLGEGFDGFLTKPLMRKELEVVLSHIEKPAAPRRPAVPDSPPAQKGARLAEQPGGGILQKIVAVVGVGNKPDEYTEADVRQLELFLNAIWNIVERDLPCDLPSDVMGDRVRIQQILHSLLGNAVKFTEQGSVTIRIACHATPQGTLTTCFSVIDTSMGIEPDKLEIFLSCLSSQICPIPADTAVWDWG